MASVRNTLCLVAALLLIYQKTATCDFLSPLTDNICKEVGCGKGKCKTSSNSTFGYECECDIGWKQFDQHLKFLPCVIPNCTFDNDPTCGEAASPVPSIMSPQDNDTSIFNVCHWVNCGGGFCNKTNLILYKCICHEGYNNLMNITILPCIKKNCASGSDCLNDNASSSSSPPALPDESSKNQATGLNLRGSSLWLIASLLCVSLAPWSLLYI